MLLNEIKQSVYNFLMVDENPFKNVLLGGLHYVHNDLDPDDVIYPYGIYNFAGGNYDGDSCTDLEFPILRITMYDNNDSSYRISDCGEKLDTRLNNCQMNLVFNSYYSLSVRRVSPPIETKTVLNNWQHSRSYKLKLQRKN
ncbi:MAG: hypothetical protein IPK06_04395 [Ignavibacteriae bacterium]|nr:hypothetical protein [Ignavibacteriota bacterium]